MRWRRRAPGPLRVLHCPSAVGGHPATVARAEREVGLDSWAVSVRPPPYGRGTDEVLFSGGWDRPLLRVARRAELVCRAARSFDVVHYNCGETILPVPWVRPRPGNALWRKLQEGWSVAAGMLDIALLDRLGLGIAMTYQGEEARLGEYCRRHFKVHWIHELPDHYDPVLEVRKQQAIELVARHADRIYSLNPDLLHVLPARAEFLPYAHIDIREWAPVAKPPSRVPVVVHAPSHRGVKGTRYVLAAVEALRARGVEVELVLVEGMSHAEARRQYERADLAIDQLLAGWYGGFAVELMALARPVVCYLRDDDLRFIPPAMREELPLIRATPTDLVDVLAEWLGPRRGELQDLGRRGRAFVDRWHDPPTIARRLARDYEAIVAARGALPGRC